ncbi:hypothetical protein RvY_06023-2 [Ramazzottius varieornatus]|uniref:Uncharacterized protein n=1 Tax=Ramazzottius varieornatus TaxID=947166 RepID=A0A1D1V2L4_RAMVA|nr:hypothetical protein RvY_06023-2 [Ramazzottius varieornatus]
MAPATTKAQVTALLQIATVTPRPAKNNGNKKNPARVAAHRTVMTTEVPQSRFNTVNATRLPATTPSHGKKSGGRLTRIEKTQVEKTVVIGEGLGGDDLQTALRGRREEATTAVVQIIQGSTTETPVVNGTIPVVVVSATVIPVEVVNVTVGSGEVVKKELDRPARQLVTGGGVGGVPMGPVGGVGAGMGPVGGVGGIGGGMGTGLGGAVVEDTVTEEIVTP